MLSYDMSKKGEWSLYEYLYRCIRADIVHGILEAHDKLPSKRTFAAHLGISVITVEKAYAQLVAEGYVQARPRSGYYVAALPHLKQVNRANHLAGSTDNAAKTTNASNTTPNAATTPIKNAPVDTSTAGLGQHTTQTTPPNLIANFTTAAQHPNESAATLWSKALRTVLAHENPNEVFATQPAQGSLRLRRAIATYLRTARGMQVSPGCIIIGAGAQHLYSTIALLAGPHTTVALENPGYPRLNDVYEAHGLTTLALPLDSEGIAMQGLLNSPASLVHSMPSHQFPTGRVTSIARRYELLSWAARTGGYIVEDDYDWEFRFAGRPIPSLWGIDSEQRVIYVSTFSKSLACALRIAFMVLPDALVHRYHEHLSFCSNTVSSIDQITLAYLLESGAYERHVNRYRKQAREIRDALIDGLYTSAFGKRIHIHEQNSGLHFVLEVESSMPESKLAARALEQGVALAPLSAYALQPNAYSAPPGRANFVMQYENIAPARIPEVIHVLEAVFTT